MGFLMSFIKVRYQPMGRQVCLTTPLNELSLVLAFTVPAISN
jgi:hypothetical protein